MSPIRTAPLAERCDRCDRLASARCKRCDRPACVEHAPARGRRCPDCERALHERLDAIAPVPVSRGLHTTAVRGGLAVSIATSPISVICGLIAVLSGGWSVLEGIGLVIFGTLTYFLCGLLVVYLASLPWIGARGTVAGSRRLRRALVRRRFLAERPGQRRLPGAEADQL